ncbi:MAG: hypothetical protein ACE5IR_00700 [bacterium]
MQKNNQHTPKAYPKRSARKFFKPRIIREWTTLWREKGFRGFAKEKGWKVVAGVVLFYLVRDTLLYLILPLWAGRSLLGC